MKTEKEKMLSNELYNHKDAELTKERNHAYELTLRYNQTKDDETELRTSILQQLAGKLGNNVVIKPPFQCDYGYNLILGDNVFMNYGCSILDCNVVEIGNNVLMAPNVQIYAAYHPTDHTLRLKDLEYADRVKIGDNTWIGGGSIILNGVTIGKKDEVERRLVQNKIPFLRIHKSFYVNFHFVDKITFSKLILSDGTVLQISQDRQNIIRKRYLDILGGTLNE